MKPAMLVLCGLLLAGAARAQPAAPLFLGDRRPAGTPRRVVSLAPNLTEILFAIGAGDRLAGVSNYDDYPEEAKRLPRVGGFIDPSVEAVLALEPDLVICVPSPGGRDRLDTLSRMGVPVLVLPGDSLQDVFTSIHTLGKLFAREDASAELAARMQAQIARVKERVAGRPRPRVLLVYGHNPIVAAGQGSFGADLIALAGGDNVLAGNRVRYPTLPLEEVIRLMPEVIIDASSSGTGAEMSPGEVHGLWGRLKVLPAVKNRRVHVFDSALWFRPGPRVAAGLLDLARIIHPDRVDLRPLK